MDVEDRARRRDMRRIGFAFIAAVMLHAGGAFALISWEPEAVDPPGDMVITIDLAPAMASQAAQTVPGEAIPSARQTPAPHPPSPPEPEPPPPEHIEKVKPEEIPEPVEQLEPPPEDIEPPPAAEKAEVVVAPKPLPKPKLEPKAKPRPTPPAQAARSVQDRKADVGGSGARAKPSDIAKYIGRLRAELERRKRYPAGAAGANGTASLRFTVNRNGKVTSYVLVRSSGNAALDGAARALVQDANLPPIPDDLPDSITIGVPVSFRVR